MASQELGHKGLDFGVGFNTSPLELTRGTCSGLLAADFSHSTSGMASLETGKAWASRGRARGRGLGTGDWLGGVV